MGTKTVIKVSLKKPLTGYSVRLTERLTATDQELINDAKNMGVQITTTNCKPQERKECGNNKILIHTLVDRDNLLEFGRPQKLRYVMKSHLENQPVNLLCQQTIVKIL